MVYPRLQLRDLLLLFVDCIDEQYVEALVLNAGDLAIVVGQREKWCDFGYVLSSQADVVSTTIFPVKADRVQESHNIKTATKTGDVDF